MGFEPEIWPADRRRDRDLRRLGGAGYLGRYAGHPLKERDTAFTIMGVSTLSTVAMMLYPAIARLIGSR